MLRVLERVQRVDEAQPGLRDAERFCREMARREAKNFYWGFISLGHDQRMAIYALYDFARQLDDDADGGRPEALPERLDAHRARIRACARGDYGDPVMQVLAGAIKRYSIPESELQMLIDGCEMDVHHTRYATWDDLAEYCKRVASVVGRMCVRIFGFSDDAALERADELGLALQLTNILRDVCEDAQLGRIYLPQDELRAFGLSNAALMEGRPEAGWDAFVAFQTERARGLFARGYEVLRYIPRRPAACVGTMAGIYEVLLEKIAADPWLPLRGRASLSAAEKLRVMVSSWLRAG
ncbi:MAG: presqualene diphosphate synthase HpnD [Candidatus Eremiobacteraeota bacterium]|nr:presqualene diphosphate synthase HpnD [Candidatus Eremiobacteraeota bacterium]